MRAVNPTSRMSGNDVDQQVGDQKAELGRLEAALLLLARTRDPGSCDMIVGVGGRPADAVLLELLDERRLGEARRRLREVLLGQSARAAPASAPSASGGSRALVVAPSAVGLGGRPRRRPRCRRAMKPSNLSTWPVARKRAAAGLDVDRRRVEDRRRHLARDEAVPDRACRARSSSVLEVRARRAPGAQLHATSAGSPRARPARPSSSGRRRGSAGRYVRRRSAPRCSSRTAAMRLVRDARRVGAHVGDEADRALVAELDALVEPLRDAHRARRLIAELARRLLLQAAT